uniref:Reverse transcriptase domain-containing protein n=1 Tax=Megaselia scalaris TaxID=36166 RepID=T1GZU2_MEGSC
MNPFGIPKKLVKLFQMTLKDAWGSVRPTGKISDKFQTIKCFRQGDTLSCCFFNILLEVIIKYANIETDLILAYVDDTDVVGRTPSDAIDKSLAIEKATKSVGLKLLKNK